MTLAAQMRPLGTAADQGQPTTARFWRGAALAVAGGTLLLLLAIAGAWHITGGRWMVVRTPSMGEAAPVGTLVLTRPVQANQVHVGDIITFRPSGSSHTFTHRVVAIDASGIHTRGDVNQAADPHPLHQHDLIGRVVARWWGIGWLLRAAPTLALGGLLVWALARYIAPIRWRASMQIIGIVALATFCLFLLRPLVAAEVITASADQQVIHVRIVSTGILPIRSLTIGSHSADLVSGQTATLTAAYQPSATHHTIRSSVHLSGFWWLTIGSIVASPLLWCLTIGLPATPRKRSST